MILRSNLLSVAIVVLACTLPSCRAQVASAKPAKCAAVLAQRWDAVLGKGWATVQDCTHPERPAHTVAIEAAAQLAELKAERRPLALTASAPLPATPLLVHPGDAVRLWSQAAMVRLEMSGIAEQAGRSGDRVLVRVTRQNEETGITVERFTGVVRGAGDTEMER